MTTHFDQPHATHADHELQRRIVNYLHRRLPHDMDAVRVQAIGGTVILRGLVRTPSLHWRLLECSRHVAGVQNVVDRIVVLPRSAYLGADAPRLAGDDDGESLTEALPSKFAP